MNRPQNFGEIHLLIAYKWVLLTDRKGFLRKIADEIGVQEFTWGLAFVYIDHEAGITADLYGFCEESQPIDSDRKVYTVLDTLLAHHRRVIFRFDMFTPMLPAILGDRDVEAMNLPKDPDWLQLYKRPDLEEIRQRAELYTLVAPGFPDDIKFELPAQKKGQGSELIWGRIEMQTPEGLYVCTLLNQPHQPGMGFNKGDRLLVEVIVNDPKPDAAHAICRGHYPPKPPARFDFFSFFKKKTR